MGEAWDELAALRTRRGECAEEVARIKAKCAQDHPQHKHVLECRECYPKVIDRMRSWYLDTKNQEWFSGREVFLAELRALFAAALDHAVGLEEIDARIDAERRKWYQEQIKASPSIRKSLEELTDHREVLAKVGSGAPFEDLMEAMQAALDGSSSREDAKKSLDRLMVAKSPEERYQLYKETFFQGSSDEHVSEKTQLYADRLQTGATMDEIVNKISLDRRSSIGASDQKERNRKRIDELRRARAAHELQKSKKASGRKDSSQKPQPPSEMYDQPPCSVCRRDVDTRSFIPCNACVVMVDAGIRSRTTVYCSPACRDSDRGEELHLEESHACASGNYCTQITDEDIDMDMDSKWLLLCRECTHLHKVESIFCSMRCADVNFRRHREEVHIPGRMRRSIQVNRDIDDIVFDGEDRSRYHARDIKSHVVPLDDMLEDFAQRNGVDIH
ncbi:hypothetical protein J7T55_011941 [Diaporthe amygdali]|uniref:uncharacterized protein n=1 Tax=Phomopsis amygdali TaxID=1214568 RepID=UPI0022FF4430|nr:uncharacterized protein J7T55_011941 [Diaporthe amygdali]KAJ0123476.1 hypothetical protein J7T55_011941 [Diaporthe amygdali]